MSQGLSDANFMRYSRHILLGEIGEAGQLALSQSSVLLVGMGGLGNPAAQYLAAAGVGHLLLADDDSVESSNLQRQVLFDESVVGLGKVEAAAQRLREMNSELQISEYIERLQGESLAQAIRHADLVLDCSDNLATRYAVNAECQRQRTPLISGAAVAFDGQLMAFDFRNAESPCYQCLFPNAKEPRLNCSNAGILGPLVGMIGTMQALEAVKLLTGIQSDAISRFSHFDGRSANWMHAQIQPNPDCPNCSKCLANTQEK
ncbi:HesA/MoeB/ThiF family protein [Paraferrimonas sedimenticola]|uniref:Adenylyltransferase n=1 Tax=Paraferrimonas sedimenticola TaxID=375674 RepID=A0AA37VZ39_9GAMM|nr:HesA/MoeB/ThiF family protein [Paraferrimonas sedimenticola]GLP95695.1 adenylyltransferase [Paraferrimonas sedimenticola]